MIQYTDNADECRALKEGCQRWYLNSKVCRDWKRFVQLVKWLAVFPPLHGPWLVYSAAHSRGLPGLDQSTQGGLKKTGGMQGCSMKHLSTACSGLAAGLRYLLVGVNTVGTFAGWSYPYWPRCWTGGSVWPAAGGGRGGSGGRAPVLLWLSCCLGLPAGEGEHVDLYSLLMWISCNTMYWWTEHQSDYRDI